MDEYTIFCTEAQTKKALELGAPIPNHKLDNHYAENLPKLWFYKDGNCYQKTTAEQLIGWLEEQKDIGEILVSKDWDEDELYTWTFDFYNGEYDHIGQGGSYNSRKEATLAAIDAALEYLTTNKK